MAEEVCFEEDVEAERTITTRKLTEEDRMQGREGGEEFPIEGIIIEEADEEED